MLHAYFGGEERDVDGVERKERDGSGLKSKSHYN
jgi:hypothetical protein